MSQLSRLARGSVFLGAAVLGLAGAPDAARAQVLISGLSLNPDGGNPNDALAVTACNGAPQLGVVYRNSETEPHLAVNPTNPANMIAGWHQDRWSTGGAQSLGAAYTFNSGATWQQVVIPFMRCSGAAPGSAGDYERASDPWISFSPNGTAHYMALVEKESVNENAMVVARSTDGGRTWSSPVVIARNPAQDRVHRSLFNDKNTLTADPFDSRLVYATWTLFRTGITSLVFACQTAASESGELALPTRSCWSSSSKADTRRLHAVRPASLHRISSNGFAYRLVVLSAAGREGILSTLRRNVDRKPRRQLRFATPARCRRRACRLLRSF